MLDFRARNSTLFVCASDSGDDLNQFSKKHSRIVVRHNSKRCGWKSKFFFFFVRRNFLEHEKKSPDQRGDEKYDQLHNRSVEK